jgi:cyclopropane-fatty-acyl-phospholipid synthase
MARRAVHSRLAGLTEGRILIREGDRHDAFGEFPTALAATIDVRDPRFYRRVVLGGGLGAAESFMDGDWAADDLTTVLRIFARNRETQSKVDGGWAKLLAPFRRLAHLFNRNSKRGSRKNIHAHYDLGNDLFALFLDETMTYSSGIFPHPRATMREASEEKLDRICRKLELAPDDHVLEIGTGWGSFAIHAAGRYGCRVTTTTISKEQHGLATQRIEAAGLSDRVEVLLTDYRDLTGTYDKLVSIEMIEAVGHEYLDDYFGKIGELIGDEGVAVLQAITMPDRGYEDYLKRVDFIQKYVFPGSCLTSVGSMVASSSRTTTLQPVHLEDLTPHYAETLRRWRERFFRNVEAVKARGYPERFVRLWDYYLRYCEAGFEERHCGVLQIVFAGPRAVTPGALRPGEVAA